MNLEGTKHEKAVLITIAYIIGFTSGFIAFGLTASSPTLVSETPLSEPFIPEGYVPPTEMPPTDKNEAAASESAPNEGVAYEDGRLYATVKGERFVLSISNSVMPNENVEGFSTQGIHEKLPTYSTSPDGRYVHFCEQQTTDDVCNHFIFDSVENVIQPVSQDGERFTTTSAEAVLSTWEGTTLVVGSHRSQTAETPWRLVSVTE